ncbi:MAG: M28 family peptidase [Solirubrobacterales bacterium]|nr:M28 family peptidase [Solirubrobacterales bacterium]
MGEEEVTVDSGLIFALSEGIGPRPPTSDRERVAAEVIAAEMEKLGLQSTVEQFDSQRSFGPTYLVIFGLALLSGALSRKSRAAGTVAGFAAASLGAAESGFALWSPLNLLRRGRSQNVWASIEPAELDQDRSRTICLVSHMDSSRSGLMFHPKATPFLGRFSTASGIALMINALAPLLDWSAPGRWLLKGVRALIGASAALILERELRGEDVAGANDNASGVAACLILAGHFGEAPLEHSRLVVLVTGSEESGVIGMREFLKKNDTEGWLFINFDGVSADAPLRVLSREGGLAGSKADPDLIAAAAEVSREHPELAAEPLMDGSGLPYDATAVNARGGKAITIANQGDGPILNYHWPTDTAANISRQSFARAVRFAAALVRKLDDQD